MPDEHQPHEPRDACAASEPRDDADRAISALLWRAGELKWRLEHPDAARSRFSGFQGTLEEFLTRTDADTGLGEELDLLVRMLAQGTALQLLFQELFQAEPRPVALSVRTGRRTDLSDREREVLTEMARGLRTAQIAEHLGIDAGTVRKHQGRIYAKLLVDAVDDLPADRSSSAVTVGELLGLTPPSLIERLEVQREAHELSLDYFAGVLFSGAQHARSGPSSPHLRRLGALGALLLSLSALVGMLEGYGTRKPPAGKFRIFQFTRSGDLKDCWDGDGRLWQPYALTFVPPASAAHGFPPGCLAISQFQNGYNTLNTNSVLLLDLDGRFVGEFTGGAFLSSRLVSGAPLAFTLDGRLLVGTGIHTDALLEFTDGGRKVRRFASLTPYSNGLTVDRRGNVYVVGGTARDCAVQVFDAEGEHLHDIGTGELDKYQDLAIESHDRLYVANRPEDCIEVYRLSGEALEPIRGGGLSRPWRLAFGPDDLLYILEDSRQLIRVYNARESSWPDPLVPPQGVHLSDLCVAPSGELFAAGWRE